MITSTVILAQSSILRRAQAHTHMVVLAWVAGQALDPSSLSHPSFSPSTGVWHPARANAPSVLCIELHAGDPVLRSGARSSKGLVLGGEHLFKSKQRSEEPETISE